MDSNIQNKNYTLKKMYRARELAEFLGVGLSTVWLYAKQGRINPIKLSPQVTVFNIDEVLKGLEVRND